MALERLDKVISSQSMLSRKQTSDLIKQGRVTVDNILIKKTEYKADFSSANISIDGHAFKYKKHIYLMLNKPAGVLSAATDKNRKTVVDLVPESIKRTGLFPVGRLDKDTTGLILITDDGDFAHKVTSPKSNIEKVYHAIVDGPVTADMIRLFLTGIKLADGTLCMPAKICVLKNAKNPLVEVKIMEGKYHQVKRMFGVLDLGVVSLKRVQIGKLKLDENMCSGECRELTETDREYVMRPKQLFG